MQDWDLGWDDAWHTGLGYNIEIQGWDVAVGCGIGSQDGMMPGCRAKL